MIPRRLRLPLLAAAGYVAFALLWALLVAGAVVLDRDVALTGVPRAQVAREVGGILYTAIIRSQYGYQFAFVTTHLWGSVGALLAYGVGHWKGRGVKLAAGVGAMLAVSLLLISARWLAAGIEDARHSAWHRQYFHHPIHLATVLLPPLAFLLAVAYLRHRRRRRNPPDEPVTPR